MAYLRTLCVREMGCGCVVWGRKGVAVVMAMMRTFGKMLVVDGRMASGVGVRRLGGADGPMRTPAWTNGLRFLLHLTFTGLIAHGMDILACCWESAE